MSFSNEIEKLNRLRKSGLITEVDFQQSKKRLLEECVRRIEALHDNKPKEFALGATVNIVEAPVERQIETPVQRQVEAPVQPQPEAPVQRQVEAPVQRQVEAPVQRQVETPVQRQVEAPVQRQVETPVQRQAEVLVQRQVANAAAAGAIRITTRGDHAAPRIPLRAQREEVRPASRDEEANDRQLEELDDRQRADVNDRHLEELNDRLLEDCVRRIETFYDRNPTYRERWGLPRVKLVRGVVMNVRFSPREETEDYTASLDIDGRPMEISSSSTIRIAAGDRVTLGGYERDGRLVILGFRNESDGSSSDLSNLRTRYRLLLAIGRVSFFAGLIAIVGTLMLLVHLPPVAANIASWRYAPYVLAGLAAAAACYVGLTLSFLGSWAKEFHDAMTPRRLPGLV